MNYCRAQETILNIFECSLEIITYKGKKSEKEYIYIKLNYFTVQLKLTILYIKYMSKNC